MTGYFLSHNQCLWTSKNASLLRLDWDFKCTRIYKCLFICPPIRKDASSLNAIKVDRQIDAATLFQNYRHSFHTKTELLAKRTEFLLLLSASEHHYRRITFSRKDITCYNIAIVNFIAMITTAINVFAIDTASQKYVPVIYSLLFISFLTKQSLLCGVIN